MNLKKEYFLIFETGGYTYSEEILFFLGLKLVWRKKLTSYLERKFILLTNFFISKIY